MKMPTNYLNKLSILCLIEQEQVFERYAKLPNATLSGRTLFIDNGANVLAVAHTDTVGGNTYRRTSYTNPTTKTVSYYTVDNRVKFVHNPKKNRVTSIQLDDRLGVWMICEYLPKVFNLKYDILLTTDEEIGQSSAQDFKLPDGKSYNWIFSFDRRGADCAVMYQYEEKEHEEFLKKYGFVLQTGSFSDISYLDHLGVTGFNFGVGYHFEHTTGCYANLDDVIRVARKFCVFFRENEDNYMKYTEKVSSRSHYYRGGGGYYSVWGDDWEDGYSYSSRWNSGTGSTNNLLPQPDDEDDICVCSLCQMEFSFDDMVDGLCLDCMDFLNRNINDDDAPIWIKGGG